MVAIMAALGAAANGILGAANMIGATALVGGTVKSVAGWTWGKLRKFGSWLASPFKKKARDIINTTTGGGFTGGTDFTNIAYNPVTNETIAGYTVPGETTKIAIGGTNGEYRLYNNQSAISGWVSNPNVIWRDDFYRNHYAGSNYSMYNNFDIV